MAHIGSMWAKSSQSCSICLSAFIYCLSTGLHAEIRILSPVLCVSNAQVFSFGLSVTLAISFTCATERLDYVDWQEWDAQVMKVNII